MKTNDFSALEKKIGYTFKDESLLREAMCHSSYVNERKSEHIKCSERLEFLGDSVLSEIVSEYLFLTYTDAPEGVLSSMRREIVDSEALVVIRSRFGRYDVFRCFAAAALDSFLKL